jgi:prevent-host-death family protein
MEEIASAAEANRQFSRLLREVREGRSYVVTAHGRPVAKIVPAGTHDRAKTGARDALLDRLRAQPVINVGRWTREDLSADTP